MSQPVAHFSQVDKQRFLTDIRPSGKPALLKGAISDWPAVNLAMRSDEELIQYLMACDNGRPAKTLLGMTCSPELRPFELEYSTWVNAFGATSLKRERHQVCR